MVKQRAFSNTTRREASLGDLELRRRAPQRGEHQPLLVDQGLGLGYRRVRDPGFGFTGSGLGYLGLG